MLLCLDIFTSVQINRGWGVGGYLGTAAWCCLSACPAGICGLNPMYGCEMKGFRVC